MAVYGFIGLLLILIAWLPETYKAIKEKKFINPLFAILYSLGSFFLAYHAFLINDLAFFVLNLIATFISLLNLFLYFLYKREKQGK